MDGSWLQLKLKRRRLQRRLHAHLTLLHVYYPWNQIKSILLLNIRITKQTNPILNPNPNNSGAAPCTNSDTPPRLSGSLLLSLTCCSPPSLLCGRNSGRLWGRSRGTTNIVIPQVILTFGLGQSNVNLLCVYMGMWNYFPHVERITACHFFYTYT